MNIGTSLFPLTVHGKKLVNCFSSHLRMFSLTETALDILHLYAVPWMWHTWASVMFLLKSLAVIQVIIALTWWVRGSNQTPERGNRVKHSLMTKAPEEIPIKGFYYIHLTTEAKCWMEVCGQLQITVWWKNPKIQYMFEPLQQTQIYINIYPEEPVWVFQPIYLPSSVFHDKHICMFF